MTENGTLTKSRGYTYDRLNRLVEIFDDTDILKTKTIAYAYDNNGNTLSKKDTSLPDQDQAFVYDSRNQLIEVKRGPPGSEESLGKYDYNAEGLRVRHRNSDRGDVDYYYDDNAVLEERKANDNSLLAHYRYADRLISLQTQTEIQYYHHDALGSTTNLTDSYGSLKVSYRLDAGGHIRKQQGDSINRQIFTGQEHDLKTGLIYFGARYYDPDIGRFITQDPYLGEQGTPPSLHRYLYAYANPTAYLDPTGNAPVTRWIADFLHGLADDSKKTIAGWNRSIKAGQHGSFGELGLRATSALVGIGAGLIETGAAVVELADLSMDLQLTAIAATTGVNLHQESVDRVKRLGETSAKLIESSVNGWVEIMTSEDPTGTVKEATTALVKGTGENIAEYFKKTFVEGDLEHTAGFSGGIFQIAMPTIGANQALKSAKLARLAAKEATAVGEKLAARTAAKAVERRLMKQGLDEAALIEEELAVAAERSAMEAALSKEAGKVGTRPGLYEFEKNGIYVGKARDLNVRPKVSAKAQGLAKEDFNKITLKDYPGLTDRELEILETKRLKEITEGIHPKRSDKVLNKKWSVDPKYWKELGIE